jgi:hypothetical protein
MPKPQPHFAVNVSTWRTPAAGLRIAVKRHFRVGLAASKKQAKRHRDSHGKDTYPVVEM